MLRSHALFILVGSVLVSASATRGDDAEDKAIAFVESLKGKIKRDNNRPGKPVVRVSLYHNKQVTDADLKELAAFKDLSSLDLAHTKITDEGIKHLAALKNLAILDLHDTKITDAGLKDLAALKSLTDLDLEETKITDTGIKVLAALKNLEQLDLGETKVTDAGVKELEKALPKCTITR